MDITETVLKFIPQLQFLALLHMIVTRHWVEGYCISNHPAILFHVFLELWSALLNDKHSTIKFNLLEWITVVILQNIFIINIEFYQMYAECFYCIWWVQTLIRTWMNFAGFSIQSCFFSHFFQSWYPLYFENLQREAMKTSKTSSRTKLISICSLNSAHWSDIISWFTNIINLVKNLNLKILSMSTNMYNIKWNVEISN